VGNLSKSGSLLADPLPSDGNRLWKVKTPPTIEPISVAEVKAFARIDGDDEDIIIEGFIKAVRENAESYLGRALIQQTIRLVMDFWPDEVINLPRPPLISITQVATLDEDDTETEYSSDNYYIINEAVPGKLVIKNGASSPTNTNRYHGGFLIEFLAGYGTDSDDVPAPIRLGLWKWVAAIYENRTYDSKEPPPEARVDLDIFRVLRF
jgi:uncharacterized phiE125 gp8 family phage protein